MSELPPADQERVQATISELGDERTPITASLFTGNKTETEYDSKIKNFSTRTNIVELSDGRKLFVVNSRNSSMHRFFDGFMKRMTECEMKKVSQKNWKAAFEEKSQIPVVAHENPDTVVLPFIPNLNMYDLFTKRKNRKTYKECDPYIKDFGECAFAKTVDEAQLLQNTDKLVQKIQEVHKKIWPGVKVYCQILF